MIVDEITLEPYFDDNGILLVREKETKKQVALLQAVRVSERIDCMQELTITVLVDTSTIKKQIKDMNNGKA